MIIVVDTISSGLGIAAQSRANCDPNVTVVSAFDFKEPQKLLQSLLDIQDNRVLFAWRGVLNELISVLPITHLQRFSEEKIVGVSIADHVSIDSLGTPIDEKWFDFVDFVFTTNETLFKTYSEFFDKRTPVYLFQDLPNIELIQKIPMIEFDDRRTDVIWIGNSKWGARQGYRDYKGLQSLFFPAIEIVKRAIPHLRVQVIDSATKQVKHTHVLHELADTRILVQTSLNEGTGLPVLEALMLGCRVVSTPVGVSQSIGEIDQLALSDFSPQGIAHQILVSLDAPLNQFRIENYLQSPPSGKDLIKNSHSHVLSLKSMDRWLALVIRFKWRVRYCQSKFFFAK